jgi:hypothetical protein
LRHVVVPTHYFTRKWKCGKFGDGKSCTSWLPHEGCGWFYTVSMFEPVFENLPSFEDVKSTSYWKRVD